MSDVAQLVHAIHEVASGGPSIDPKVVEALVRARAAASVAARPPHATRERGARRDGPGQNNAAIAAALVLSERAVEKHINSLFSKLGLTRNPT